MGSGRFLMKFQRFFAEPVDEASHIPLDLLTVRLPVGTLVMLEAIYTRRKAVRSKLL